MNKGAWFACLLALLSCAVQAVTLRVANQGDAQSMDPHSLNEALQLTFTNNVYEHLVARERRLALTPGLAIRWTQPAPTVWRFELRRGMSFHDGAPFTADDVVFSLARAAGPGSDMQSHTRSFKEVRKLDSQTVEIETVAPFPILPLAWAMKKTVEVIQLADNTMPYKWVTVNERAK